MPYRSRTFLPTGIAKDAPPVAGAVPSDAPAIILSVSPNRRFPCSLAFLFSKSSEAVFDFPKRPLASCRVSFKPSAPTLFAPASVASSIALDTMPYASLAILSLSVIETLFFQFATFPSSCLRVCASDNGIFSPVGLRIKMESRVFSNCRPSALFIGERQKSPSSFSTLVATSRGLKLEAPASSIVL